MLLEFYRVMPICRFVKKYGPESFEASMNATEEGTIRITGKYAVRSFIGRHP